VEEESSPPYLKDVVTNSKKEMMNLEDTTLMATCTIVHNGFQQTKRPTNGTWFNSICKEQNLTTPLKLATIAKPNKRRIPRNYV